jgi:hypothetical protein
VVEVEEMTIEIRCLIIDEHPIYIAKKEDKYNVSYDGPTRYKKYEENFLVLQAREEGDL